MFLYNHSTIIQTRTFDLDAILHNKYYTTNTAQQSAMYYSGVLSCFNNVLYGFSFSWPRIQFRIMHCTQLWCLFNFLLVFLFE